MPLNKSPGPLVGKKIDQLIGACKTNSVMVMVIIPLVHNCQLTYVIVPILYNYNG